MRIRPPIAETLVPAIGINSNLSLEQVRRTLQLCLDVRKRFEALKVELRAALIQRTTLDATARQFMPPVAYSVWPGPEDGENCAI